MNLSPRLAPHSRTLQRADGSPFFYLADTGWCLFHRLNQSDAEHYLQTRAAQGFTVIQAVALAEHGGLHQPNAQGDFALERVGDSFDPLRPIEKYWQHVDWIIERANQLGLVVALLPTWGDKWNRAWGEGPEIFTPENAMEYGRWISARYKDQPIIWVLGGDRPVENERHREIIEAMSRGLSEGDGQAHLQTFHPRGGAGSADYFKDAAWINFHMRQTGHGRDSQPWKAIGADYAQISKPIVDGEPGYENHPAGFNLDNGRLSDYDARRFAYWSLFSGACGHTYGCHDIWQFAEPRRQEPHRKPINAAYIHWREALQFPGAWQMRHARALLESRPFFHRVPDQNLLIGSAGEGLDHAQATRDESGAFALIYLASGREIEIDTSKLSGDRMRAWWFDPRSGASELIGEFAREPQMKCTPPVTGRGMDWVLVLDDASRNFPAPGAAWRE